MSERYRNLMETQYFFKTRPIILSYIDGYEFPQVKSIEDHERQLQNFHTHYEIKRHVPCPLVRVDKVETQVSENI